MSAGPLGLRVRVCTNQRSIDFEEEPPFFDVTSTHKAKTWYLDPRAPKIEQPKSIKMLREKMRK